MSAHLDRVSSQDSATVMNSTADDLVSGGRTSSANASASTSWENPPSASEGTRVNNKAESQTDGTGCEAKDLWEQNMRKEAVELASRIGAGTSSQTDIQTIGSEVDDILNRLEHDKARTPDDRTLNQMVPVLETLSNALYRKFLSQIEYLDIVIRFGTRSTLLIPEGHEDRPGWLNNLGRLHQFRFQRLHTIEDLNIAIKITTRVVELTPKDHQRMPMHLSNLANLHRNRFERLDRLEDIDKAVECLTRAVMLTPEGDAALSSHLHDLGTSYLVRFKRLGNVDDVNAAIAFGTKSVQITPEDHAQLTMRIDFLANSYQVRFEHLGDPGDIDSAIKYHEQAVSLISPGDRRMPGRLNNLGISYQRRFERLGHLDDIDKAISIQSQAVMPTSQDNGMMYGYFNNFGASYQLRYSRLGKLEDLDRTIEYQTRAVQLTPKGHADMPGLLNNLGGSHRSRFQRLHDLKDIDRAIEYQAESVTLLPEDHIILPLLLNQLGNSHILKYQRLEKLEDINRAIELQSRAVQLAPRVYANKPTLLSDLGNAYMSRFKCLDRREDIDKSIEYSTQAVSLTPKDHMALPGWLNNLGKSYQSRFDRLGEQEDIDNAIQCHTQAVSLIPEGYADGPMLLNNLGQSLLSRFKRLGDRQCLADSLECFRKSAQSFVGHPKDKFAGACNWARASAFSTTPDSESLQAYQIALGLVPQLVWLGATIDQRYYGVQQLGGLALEAAAAAITAQEYYLALEWLEQGRSIVWNQTLQLQTPVDELASSDPELANNLRRVTKQLHDTGSQNSPLGPALSDATSLEQAAQKHRRLAEEYEKLVNQARRIPGFQHFLQPKKAPELINAAQNGPVVVINVHQSRCDALVLQPGKSEVTHIPLPELSYHKAANAQAEMELLIQHGGIRNRDGFRGVHLKVEKGGFERVLADLWTDVTFPVLDTLGLLRKPAMDDLPHVTWCATGPLSFLPIHASGCYDQPHAKIFDYVISSYTPTLSALIPSASISSIAPSTILAVGQETVPGQSLEPLDFVNDELASIKKYAQLPLGYTQLNNHNATTAAVLAAMEQHDCVHLACHASQDHEDPTKSGFFLHDGTLTLTRIMQKSFKNKGLAFLSACQTATGDKELPDEAVHLASAMLMAGYSSVIATMWSIKDKDAPVIADRVYGQLLKDGKMDYKGTAKALHVAVGDLRREIGEKEFARWAPYIHIGI